MRLRRSGFGAAALSLGLLPWALPLAGQGAGDTAGTDGVILHAARLLPAAGPAAAWLPPVTSAVLPGAGQFLQGRRRGWLYLAVEALVWGGYAVERGRGADDRRAYRDLAWDAARLAGGSRVDGEWEYYERMSFWLRSGAFDADPGTEGLQPEEDPSTFNGHAWRLAVGIFLGGGTPDPGAPGYPSALAYYRERAYPDPFLWDWTGKGRELERYRGLIRRSDDHFRNASLILGGALVNRVVSSLDAVLTRQAGRSTSLRVLPGAGPDRRLRQTLILRVALQ